MSNKHKVEHTAEKLGTDKLAKSDVPKVPVEVIADIPVLTSVKPVVAAADKYLQGYTLLVETGKAVKLSPKTQNHVFYQVATKDDDGSLHLRLSGNEGGGLHSKEWLSVQAIVAVLDSVASQPIKSTVLKSVFKGGSANNVAFLAAVLRGPEIGLLAQSDKSVFIHQLSADYAERKGALLKLANIPAQ